MGDRRDDTVRVDFDRNIKLALQGSTVTRDAGLLAYRELDDALRLTSTAVSGRHDTRTGKNTQPPLTALLRQSIYSRLAGYKDVNDAERLCIDPALRTIVGGQAKHNPAASTSEMARFETEILSTQENLTQLMDLSSPWIDQAHQHRKLTKLIRDMDSSVRATYGHQEGTAYHGYFACLCYHPLVLFNQFGDLERGMLRRGNHPSAQFGRRVLLPVLERYRDRDLPKYFRGDSALALPKLLRRLEQEGFRYAIRIKSNPVLERKIARWLKRPVGQPSHKPKVFYHSFRYPARSWACDRRGVVKVEWHAGELFPRVGFIGTNLKGHAKKVVRFYNRRGTAAQWIKEGKNAVKWTKLSCRRFQDNATRLQWFARAYHLANFLRQRVLPRPIRGWTLTTLREKLLKIGAKVVRHSKYVLFQLAEVAVPRQWFARILERIARWCPSCASG
jgi:hypothetical protein